MSGISGNYSNIRDYVSSLTKDLKLSNNAIDKLAQSIDTDGGEGANTISSQEFHELSHVLTPEQLNSVRSLIKNEGQFSPNGSFRFNFSTYEPEPIESINTNISNNITLKPLEKEILPSGTSPTFVNRNRLSVDQELLNISLNEAKTSNTNPNIVFRQSSTGTNYIGVRGQTELIKKVQKVLGVPQDGLIGPKTIEALISTFDKAKSEGNVNMINTLNRALSRLGLDKVLGETRLDARTLNEISSVSGGVMATTVVGENNKPIETIDTPISTQIQNRYINGLNEQSSSGTGGVTSSNETSKQEYIGSYRIQDPSRNIAVDGTTIISDNDEIFNSVMRDSNITADSLKQEILQNANPLLRNSLENMMERLGSNKEAMMYLREVLNRIPPIDIQTTNKIINKLNNMFDTHYDTRIGSAEKLVVSALADIAAPSNIDQEFTGSCVGTSIQIQLAIVNPNEYLNMLDTLAKNQDYETLGGQTIKPNWTFVNEDNPIFIVGKGIPAKDSYGQPIFNTRGQIQTTDGKFVNMVSYDTPGARALRDKNGDSITFTNTNRTLSAKIMQNAIMDFADDKKALASEVNREKPLMKQYVERSRNYNSSLGVTNENLNYGLYSSQGNEALSQILGLNNSSISRLSGEYSKDKIVELITQARPSSNNPILIGMKYSSDKEKDAYHALNVVDISLPNKFDTEGSVTLINPYGRVEKIPLPEFSKRIDSASIPRNILLNNVR